MIEMIIRYIFARTVWLVAVFNSNLGSYSMIMIISRSIGKMTEHEESHKLNRRRNGIERQEEDMLRVPIALALVKLLQRLPGELLKYQLPG